MKLPLTAEGFAALALTMIMSLVTPLTMPLAASDWALSGAMPGRHRGKINAVIHHNDVILSAGEDGFLEIWNTRANAAAERFQVSPYRITAMAGRPGKDEVCLLENDGLGLYRIAVWNYTEWRNIFTRTVREPVAHVTYSMGGKFIIAARSGTTGLMRLDSDSGDSLPDIESLTETVGAAVTGRSERNMLVYMTSGALSYWELETGTETNYFEAPPDLASPVFFGNSRYLAGIHADGLVVVHATSGELIAEDRTVPLDAVLCPAGDNLICLIQKEGEAAELNRYSVDRIGTLILNGQTPLAAAGDRFTAIAATAGANGIIALGTDDGSVVLAGMNGQIRRPAVKDQLFITEAAVSGSSAALLAENGTIVFIPKDYNQLSARKKLNIQRNEEAHNRVTAYAAKNNAGGQFILWQDRGDTQPPPVIRSANAGSAPVSLGAITFRSSLRSADSCGGKILFLDSTGNISVVSPFDTVNPPSSTEVPPADVEQNAPFGFFSVGLMDAVFVNRNQILLGRSAVAGNTPFMLINITTGETVPLSYPAQAGVMLHRGALGTMYAVTISSQPATTSIVRFNSENSEESVSLVDFQGEDTLFAIAEIAGGLDSSLAATIGGEGAVIYNETGIQNLERTAGFPQQLFDGGSSIISRDSDGAITWHDSHNGKLLAVFRLQSAGWTLQTEQRTINGSF